MFFTNSSIFVLNCFTMSSMLFSLFLFSSSDISLLSSNFLVLFMASCLVCLICALVSSHIIFIFFVIFILLSSVRGGILIKIYSHSFWGLSHISAS